MNLAQYRVKIRDLLDDTGATRYTEDQIDTALRNALEAYAEKRPLSKTYVLDGTGEQRITLPSDFVATGITRAELIDDTPSRDDELVFIAEKVDEGWTVETVNKTIQVGDQILLTYYTGHTVDGLDSAAGTTIPAEHTLTVAIGAAGFAAQSRAVSRAETINLQKEVRKQLQELASTYLTMFNDMLADSSKPAAAKWTMPTIKFG